MPVEAGPDQPFQHVSRNVNKIVEQIQKGYSNFRPNDYWAPNVNLYETDEMYLVCVDLAGVDKETINPEVSERPADAAGNPGGAGLRRTDPTPTARRAGQNQTVKVHLMEIDHGAFYREVELPDRCQPAKIAAHYRNGMLWIELPKK